MALTLTEEFRMTAGGRAFRYIKVTHDEATSTFTAASVDLDKIEAVIPGTIYLASTPADVSTLIAHSWVSIITDGTKVEFGLPPKAASTTRLLLIGW